MGQTTPVARHSVAVIGGGQAGLSISWHLARSGIDHVVFEKERAGHVWRAERWDTFCLVTPNWQCQLPGFPYQGGDPHGFMLRDEIVDYLDAFVASFNPPLREGVRDKTNHYVTGRDGGRDIDLRQRALEGMELYGRLLDVKGDNLLLDDDLALCLDQADQVSESIKTSIDGFISKKGIAAPEEPRYRPVWSPPQERPELDYRAAGINAIVWCIGFRTDYSWIDLPVFNGRGQPAHVRGVTPVPGVYFLGLPWLYTWGSGRFSGVARDAEYLAEHIKARVGLAPGESRSVVNEAAIGS